MSGVEFRAVTILYDQKDSSWCSYVVDHFKPDQLQVKVVTLDVSSLDYENPPEIQTAIAESHVVMFLTTCHLLEYMEEQARWLIPMLKTRDRNVTTVVTALLGATTEQLSEVTDQYPYDIDKQWEIMEIDVSGSNIKECIAKVFEFKDKNAERWTKRIPTRTYSDRTTLSSPGSQTRETVMMIPRYVYETGETIALIFTKEKAKGSVTVYAEGIKIEIDTINPYCVTFKAPEMTSRKMTIQVDVNNTKLTLCKLRAMKTPHFTSLELMCQSYGVSKKEELDKKLAETFTSSIPANSHAMLFFNDAIKNPPTGIRNCQYPTLLHWAAANGLKELCSALLSAPGANDLCNILNCDDDDVAELADKNGYRELADFITEFVETKHIADVCDRYVQSCRVSSDSTPIYEDMSGNFPGNYPSPTIVPRVPVTFHVSPRLSSHEEEDDNYVVPDIIKPLPTPTEFLNAPIETVLPAGATGCRSQAELIEIQKEVKKGNFSIREAEMLFNSWKNRYETGNAISFKEKQQSLQAMREQYQKPIDVLKGKCVKQKKGKKKESPTISQGLLKISDPIGMRKMAGAMPPSPGRGRGSDGSLSRVSHDSGRYSNRDSNLSHTSTSSEEYEVGDERLLLRESRSQSERSAERSTEIRQSTRDMYLELTRESSNIPDSTAPPLPPRRGQAQPQEVIKAPQVKPKPNFAQKPQPALPTKSSATLPLPRSKR